MRKRKSTLFTSTESMAAAKAKCKSAGYSVYGSKAVPFCNSVGYVVYGRVARRKRR